MKKIFNYIVFIMIIMAQPCFAASEAVFATKKFAIAMLGVVLSAVLIFVMLSVYNKLFHNTKANNKSSFDDKNLGRPETLDAAISNFLNKTKM